MTEDEKRYQALRITEGLVQDCEFSYVYEDEQLEDATEDELREIHDLIRNSVVMLP